MRTIDHGSALRTAVSMIPAGAFTTGCMNTVHSSIFVAIRVTIE